MGHVVFGKVLNGHIIVMKFIWEVEKTLSLEMVYGYWIYDGRCSMFGAMFLGVGSPLILVLVDGIKCETISMCN